jgi:hypothetical protein
MPRGKPGTGPHARKRIQRQFTTPETEYMRLALSEEETKTLYTVVQEALKKTFGTTEGFHLSNVAYRITEYVMLDKLGLPKKEPPQVHEENGKPRRGRRKRVR